MRAAGTARGASCDARRGRAARAVAVRAVGVVSGWRRGAGAGEGSWMGRGADGGGAPNMCITIVKRSNFERPYLDNYWVTNEKLCGNGLGHRAPAQIR